MLRIHLLFILFLPLFLSAQSNKGNLLLIRAEVYRNLEIDSYKEVFHVIELTEDFSPLNDDKYSVPVYTDRFTDSQLSSCIAGDSIKLKTLSKNDAFTHANAKGVKNEQLINNLLDKMQYLMQMKVESEVYDEKIKISYIIINCNYCIGPLANDDADRIGYKGKAALIIDSLTILEEVLPKEYKYDIIKKIDFNNIIYFNLLL